MRVLRQFLLIFVFLFGAFSVSAQEYDRLFDPFTPSRYSRDELRFLQLGLALEGYYNGLLDGAWGRISNRAITQYANQEFDDPPQEIHAAFLAYSTADFLVSDQWEMRYFDDLGLSFLIPTEALIEAAHTDHFLNYEHAGSSLKLSIGFGDLNWAEQVHQYALDFGASYDAPYTLRKPGIAITSATNRMGQTLYVRSLLWRGQWSTLMISAYEQDAGLLAAITASISTERNASLYVPEGGYLFSVVATTSELLDALEEDATPEPSRNAGIPPEDEDAAGSSGTGFVVSAEGHILTNAHVVEGCHTLTVNDRDARLINISTTFDLALLQTDMPSNQPVAMFASSTARLNQDVIAVGYPYAGLLGGVNVTRGAVSSMTGLGGDETTMQITAPVQPGNSGGPVLSDKGEVLGVVVSKLDALVVADALGDIPQNVNFAIRGEAAKLFLSLNGVTPQNGTSDMVLSPVELAEKATGFTVFIACE